MDKLSIMPFYEDHLSVYLIFLHDSSTLKGYNWIEKLQNP